MASTKRERLLDWIRTGDPEDVPVLLGPGFEVVAARLGKELADITWDDAARVAEETGTHNVACVHSPYPFHAVPFLDDIRIREDWSTLPGGTRRLVSVIETPEGLLKAVQEFPKATGSYHREFFVKDERDLPAWACYIRRTTAAVAGNPAVRAKIDAEIKAASAEVAGRLPLEIHVFCPAMELISSHYMDQATAIYTLYDHPDLMEELMECHWRMTEVWLEVAAANRIDIYNYAVNGFEWLSPDIYQRYMIPQARRINAFAAGQGKLSWIHTCCKMQRIARGQMYEAMNVSVVESLSSPPTGDIDNLAETRRDIGAGRTTRGGINVEYFYGSDTAALARRVEYVLAGTAGYRHMLGDTDPSYPAYPWANIQRVIDEVRKRARLFE